MAWRHRTSEEKKAHFTGDPNWLQRCYDEVRAREASYNSSLSYGDTSNLCNDLYTKYY